jgi:PilZ domain
VYRVSPKQLISARDFVQDMRSGTTDAALIAKYNLSPNRLQSIFKKLLDANAMTAKELDGRCASFDDSVQTSAKACRLLYRHVLDFVLPIYEEAKPEILGMVLNITEGGVGLSGIHARVGESKNFVIPADEFFDVGRTLFQARCCWVGNEIRTGERFSGFEVTSISAGDLSELRKLIQLIQLVDIEEVVECEELSDETSDGREQTRYTVDFRLPIHEATNRENKGTVINISEDGIGIKGIDAQPGERKTFVIPAYHGFVTFDSIVTIAECRWANTDEATGEKCCGFKLLQLTARNSTELSKLIATLMVH